VDLRFVTRESDYLVFEAADGTKFRALIDESVREAVKRTHVVERSGFSPKEVQAQIRLGLSIAEVAEVLGVPESAVEPFALPILDELRYVLDAALNTSLPDGPTMKRFEDIVLASDPAASFRVLKTEEGWQIEGHGAQNYSWLFNPKTRVIEPINEAARKVGKTSSVRDAIFTPVAQKSQPEASVEPASEPSASVHDLVEELRSRRNIQSDIKPQTAKGRASLPSWDEIVLGTSNLDPDADQRNS
jgi:hypothetical protein